jgi:hypothetical protein
MNGNPLLASLEEPFCLFVMLEEWLLLTFVLGLRNRIMLL